MVWEGKGCTVQGVSSLLIFCLFESLKYPVIWWWGWHDHRPPSLYSWMVVVMRVARPPPSFPFLSNGVGGEGSTTAALLLFTLEWRWQWGGWHERHPPFVSSQTGLVVRAHDHCPPSLLLSNGDGSEGGMTATLFLFTLEWRWWVPFFLLFLLSLSLTSILDVNKHFFVIL
jgi:hypothetical protein